MHLISQFELSRVTNSIVRHFYFVFFIFFLWADQFDYKMNCQHDQQKFHHIPSLVLFGQWPGMDNKKPGRFCDRVSVQQVYEIPMQEYVPVAIAFYRLIYLWAQYRYSAGHNTAMRTSRFVRFVG
jgi:hypothetical protein